MKRHIILVGPMGAGKTTIGRMLAQELALPFKDIDHLVEEKAGASISWIFEKEGEQGFRRRESQTLADLLQEDSVVIATGGGVVNLEVNREMLKQAGNVVFLNAPVELQYLRTQKDKGRPLLQQQNPESVLRKLMEQREPWYRDVADIVVDVGKKKPQSIVRYIVEHVTLE